MDALRERLRALRNGLLKLHKALLESERAAYEKDIARITSTGQYLGLVLNDPWFHWLHELSQFIVLIDETLDRKDEPITQDEADRLMERARLLLVPAEEGSGFARRYFEVLQSDPGTVLAHRDMLQVLNGL
jgi:uncharacterized protein with von Willebrand factor type A (vWA) domain